MREHVDSKRDRTIVSDGSDVLLDLAKLCVLSPSLRSVSCDLKLNFRNNLPYKSQLRYGSLTPGPPSDMAAASILRPVRFTCH